ncbi:MAG: PHP domain-containing protein [Acholeplasmatales bacterium]|nr:PHP domain-containing protein [Acholeplasmatales bacterium]
MRVDLHNHTFHSDGILSEEELVKRAILNHVDCFALTDHDSVFGCEKIYEIGKKYGVKVIKGMELSTYYKGESVHIVCLFKKNIIPKSIYDFSYDFKEKRKNRAILMMQKIKDIYGLSMNVDELIKKSEVITRANMLNHLMEYNNLTREEAQKYISNDSKAYIPSTKMSVADGLKLARSADCFVIFAHPCLIKNQEYVEEILKYGFDGIEVKYPSKKNDEAKFRALANKYNLLISAGSDCHRGNLPDLNHGDIGTCTLTEEEFKPILEALEIEF